MSNEISKESPTSPELFVVYFVWDTRVIIRDSLNKEFLELSRVISHSRSDRF